jgi:hypothetical protein
LQLSVVHGLPSLQISAVPAVQMPLWQVSTPLQTLASAQEVPFTTGEYSQPKTGSQLSVVQGLPSLQLSAVPAVQVPLWQVSSPLHGLPSAHDEPFGTGALWQPVTELQLSAVQGLPSLHTGGVPAVQMPL